MKRRVVAALAVVVTAGGATCGGTSGREDLPAATGNSTVSEGGGDDAQDAEVDGTTGAPVDATIEAGTGVDGGVALDATMADDSLYTGAFDVAIQYADRPLPDVQAAPEAGSTGEAGPAFPNCPPFLPVNNGRVVSLDNSSDQQPSVYGPDGGEILAPDGSVCATYPWLGTVAIDECVTENYSQFIYFPPCNWAVGAGFASTGPGAGRSRYDLCIALYQCFLSSGCYLYPFSSSIPQFAPDSTYWCFCGVGTSAVDPACSSNPQGACLQQELAAMEIDPTVPASQVVKDFHSTASGPGVSGRMLNVLFYAVADTKDCYAASLALLDGGANAPRD